jgi:hypothetical protein
VIKDTTPGTHTPAVCERRCHYSYKFKNKIWNTTLPKTTLIGLEGKENSYPQQQEDLRNNFLRMGGSKSCIKKEFQKCHFRAKFMTVRVFSDEMLTRHFTGFFPCFFLTFVAAQVDSEMGLL